MGQRYYSWRMPYTPAGFYRGAGRDFSLSININKSINDYWVHKNESIGQQSGYEGFYWRDHISLYAKDSLSHESWFFDELVSTMASLFEDRVEDGDTITQADLVNYFMSFVHQFPYATDKRSTGISEYARFPIETLYDKQGDCECLAILLIALLNYADICETGFIRVKKSNLFSADSHHVAGGVVNDYDDSIYGTYVSHGGSRYYYCEATASGWKAGQIPDDYERATFWVYPLSEAY